MHDDIRPDEESRLRLARVWPMVAVLLLVATLEFAGGFIGMSIRDGAIDIRQLDPKAIAWLLWFPFLPGVVAVTEWLRPDRRAWGTVIGGHVTAGLLAAIIHPTVAFGAIYPLIPRDIPIEAYYRGVVNRLFVMDFLVYVGCVVAYLAQHYLRRTHEERLAAARADVRATRLEGLMTDARLAALRRELRPHFLHNALQSVSGLIREGHPDRAIRMLDELESLFRRSLASSDGRPVALAEELRLLDNYLAIELVRFEDRMSVKYDVPDDLLDIPVPPLILQPLVENAVRHGVARSARPVAILVKVRSESGRCRIVVENDGPALRRAGRVGGVGLDNTGARLRLLYGPTAGVTLRARDGGGAIAEVEFPVVPSAAAPRAG